MKVKVRFVVVCVVLPSVDSRKPYECTCAVNKQCRGVCVHGFTNKMITLCYIATEKVQRKGENSLCDIMEV
jgi:hypothetical protein